MLLYLVRHAIAVPREETSVVGDASRRLTPDGINKMWRNVKGLRRLGVELDQVWTSPLTRARQTAYILADVLEPTGGVKVVHALSPEGSFEDVAEKISRAHDVSHLALVGHEPYLGAAIARLMLEGVVSSSFPLKKGGMACIELEDTALPLTGLLRWLLTPRMLRLLNK